MRASGLTRRRAWLFAMGGFATASSTLPWRALASPTWQIPSGPWVLSRRLTRGLRDDKAIEVKRSWRITFAAQSQGVAIAGEQLSVSVTAPGPLAPIARIEEERTTAGMFPILLAPDGIIVAAGPNSSQASVEAAIETANELLSQSGLTQGAAEQRALDMAQLQKAGSTLLDELPGDLFYPSTKPFRDVRTVALPDGSTGEFELTWAARAQKDTGLLQTARREFITRVGDDERRSREDWSLEPL